MNIYLIVQYAYFKWAHWCIYDMHRHFLFLLEKKTRKGHAFTNHSVLYFTSDCIHLRYLLISLPISFYSSVIHTATSTCLYVK